MKKILASILAASLMAGAVSACKGETDPGEQVIPDRIVDAPMSAELRELDDSENEQYRRAYLNTAFDLLRNKTGNGTNVMISPASIMIALSMAEAGAHGTTRDQMAALWGGQQDSDGQLSYAAELLDRLNSSEGVSMHAADSMWINQQILAGVLKDDYVDFVRDNYDSEVNMLDLDDAALDRINGWVDENTDGMIDKIIDSFEPDTAMMLLNAIAFDGSWQQQYEEHQVHDGTFRNSDGTESDVTMLHSEEGLYLENDDATGFIKFYEGCQYAFVVMLPKDEDCDADSFLADFTGDDFNGFMDSQTYEYQVFATLPEFEYDYGDSFAGTLRDLGMTDAFSPAGADLTGIAELEDGNLYIGDVIHKTHIEVDSAGTRAAAVTAVSIRATGAMIGDDNIRRVECDRPFAYAIVDTTDNTPVFIGTVNNL